MGSREEPSCQTYKKGSLEESVSKSGGRKIGQMENWGRVSKGTSLEDKLDWIGEVESREELSCQTYREGRK